jgi:60 kDa SS-A/Ro ribonucleoprotein
VAFPYKDFSTKRTPQNEAIPGKAMVANSAGGYSFPLDKWEMAKRFLILGSEGGTYYIKEQKLTKDNANSILACIQEDGPRLVKLIVEISENGRAPKNDPAIFALALASATW